MPFGEEGRIINLVDDSDRSMQHLQMIQQHFASSMIETTADNPDLAI